MSSPRRIPVLLTGLDVQEVRRSAGVLNLKVVRDIDPLVQEICSTVRMVFVYYFNHELGQWCKQGIKGPLFLLRRTTAPYHKLMVLNQKTPDNIVVDLLDDYEIRVLGNLLVFENLSHELTGIWFAKIEDLNEVLNHLARTFSLQKNEFGAWVCPKIPQQAVVSNDSWFRAWVRLLCRPLKDATTSMGRMLIAWCVALFKVFGKLLPTEDLNEKESRRITEEQQKDL